MPETISARMHQDPDSKRTMTRWLQNWERVGPILQAERWTRLTTMTKEDAQRVVLSVLDLWQPDWSGDDGEELLLHQRVFARAGNGR